MAGVLAAAAVVHHRSVSGRSGAEARSRYDPFRLVVLGLTLVGFMAMHGLASAGGESSHCAVPDTLLSPVATAVHEMTDVGMIDGGMINGGTGTTAPADVHPAVDSTVASPGSTGDGDEKSMTGCLLALLGALVALALRLVRLSAGHTAPMPASAAAPRECAARAPPPPLFLSLCVIRL
jgi:hypothetical protein